MTIEKDGCLCFDGYKLIKDSLDTVPMEGKNLMLTVSPNSYGISTKDSVMNEALKKCDYLQLDGLYFGWLPLLRDGKKARRITGWDSFIYYAEKLQERGGKMFFLGSTEETLSKIKIRMNEDFPAVEIGTYSPPFKSEFSEEDNEAMRAAVKDFGPDVLIVGMTAPKQEKWAFLNREYLDAHVIICVGNVFDWYAGNTKRPGPFWQKIGLEWLVRIFYRPEIFRRNIGNQMIFFCHLALALLHIRDFSKNTPQILVDNK